MMIVGVIVEILKAAGVFDWLVKWFESLLAGVNGEDAYAPDQIGANVRKAFELTRPPMGRPLRRVTQAAPSVSANGFPGRHRAHPTA